MSMRLFRSCISLIAAYSISIWFFGCSGSVEIDSSIDQLTPISPRIPLAMIPPEPPTMPPGNEVSSIDRIIPNLHTIISWPANEWHISFPDPDRWYSFGVPLESIIAPPGFPSESASRLWRWMPSDESNNGSWESVTFTDPLIGTFIEPGFGYFYYSSIDSPAEAIFIGTPVNYDREQIIPLSQIGWHLVSIPCPAGTFFQSLDLSSLGVRVGLADGLTRDRSGAFPFLYFFAFRYQTTERRYLTVDLEADPVDPAAAYWIYSFRDDLRLHLPAFHNWSTSLSQKQRP